MPAPTRQVSGTQRHLQFLDGVRGLAALYVVIHHSIIHLPVPAQLGRTEWFLRKLGGFGHYAVDVFIVLSGYCLMLPLLNGKAFELSSFFVRRAVRILPAYFLAAALSLALIATLIDTPTGTLWDHSIPVTTADVISHVLLVHDWIPEAASKINLVFWSVAVEWKIYFLFPLLLATRARVGTLATTLAAVFASYVAWLICYEAQILNPSPWGSSFYYLGLFALGMLAAERGELWAAAADVRFRVWLQYCLATSTAAIAVLSYYSDDRIPLQVQSLPVGLWAALLLLTLRLDAAPRWVKAVSTAWIPTWLGRMGYSLYLIHAPILQLAFVYIVKPIAHRPNQVTLMFLIGPLLTVPVALMFYLLAERPFHRLSRHVNRLLVKSTPADPSAQPAVVGPSVSRTVR